MRLFVTCAVCRSNREYEDAMGRAKKRHLNIWQYGDITADDAKEFGTGR